MHRLAPIFASLSVCILVAGCGKRIVQPAVTWQNRLSQQTLNELQFTQIIADLISNPSLVDATAKTTQRDSHPTVAVVAPLKVSIDLPNGETTCHLRSVWDACREAPGDRVQLVNEYVSDLLDTIHRLGQNAVIDINQVVPLVKSEKWLAETDKQGMNLYREKLAADLFVIYAEDGPSQLRFIDRTSFDSFDRSLPEVRAKAIENLRKKLGERQRHGTGPLYMLTAGGVFEASLLLCADVWDELDDAVDGRLVVAVPSRELLMVTGENAPEAIQQMRAIAEDTQEKENYLISKELLIRVEGRWKRYAENLDEVPRSPR